MPVPQCIPVFTSSALYLRISYIIYTFRFHKVVQLSSSPRKTLPLLYRVSSRTCNFCQNVFSELCYLFLTKGKTSGSLCQRNLCERSWKLSDSWVVGAPLSSFSLASPAPPEVVCFEEFWHSHAQSLSSLHLNCEQRGNRHGVQYLPCGLENLDYGLPCKEEDWESIKQSGQKGQKRIKWRTPNPVHR